MSNYTSKISALIGAFILPLAISAQSFSVQSPERNPVPTDAMPVISKTKNLNIKEINRTDFSGHYSGKRYQYTSGHTGILRTYVYEMDLIQNGSNVSGTTRISSENGDYGLIKLRGMVVNDKLYFEEYEIIDQKKSDMITWCYKIGELQMGKHDRNVIIYGPTNSYTAMYFTPCTGGFTLLEKADKEHNSGVAAKEVNNNYVSDMNVNPGFAIQVFPNPFGANSNLAYTLDKDSRVMAELYDINGSLMKIILNENQMAGTHQVALDGSKLGSGVYIIKLTINGEVHSKQIIKADI